MSKLINNSANISRGGGGSCVSHRTGNRPKVFLL